MDARLKTFETSPPATRLHHGWLMVAAAFLVALFGWGLGFYGPGIYLVALRERFGWSAADIAFAVTVYYLLGATLIFFFVGAAFDRYGVRRVSGAAVNIIVAPWFERRRGLAVSLALNGASAGGLVMAPLLIFLIDRFGFAPALPLAAALMLAVLLPLLMLVAREKRPGEYDRDDGPAAVGPVPSSPQTAPP